MKTSAAPISRSFIVWFSGASLVAAALLGSYSASAYSFLDLFELHPSLDGGGGGRFFSGSIKDGLTCEVCHVPAADSKAPDGLVEIVGLPLEGFKAGEDYELEFVYPKGAKSIAAVAEFLDASGEASGSVAKASLGGLARAELEPAEILETEDGRVIFGLSSLEQEGFTATWTAPEDSSFATFHAAIVIGDGSGDPLGDRVQVVHHELRAAGSATPRKEISSDSNAAGKAKPRIMLPLARASSKNDDGMFNCSLAPNTKHGFSGLAILGFLALAGRSRRWRLGLGAFVSALCLSGCVKPHERGRLASPDMAFDGNGDLLAGQRHGTDYREGSSGGFGGGGGGCGCN